MQHNTKNTIQGSSWSEARELAKLREQEVEKAIAMPRFFEFGHALYVSLI